MYNLNFLKGFNLLLLLGFFLDKIPVRVLMATSGQIIESDISLNVDKTVVNFVSKATGISVMIFISLLVQNSDIFLHCF